MQLDKEALQEQIDEEFEEAYKEFLDITFPYGRHNDLVKIIRTMINKYFRHWFRAFYYKGYRGGFETCKLYKEAIDAR